MISTSVLDSTESNANRSMGKPKYKLNNTSMKTIKNMTTMSTSGAFTIVGKFSSFKIKLS